MTIDSLILGSGRWYWMKMSGSVALEGKVIQVNTKNGRSLKSKQVRLHKYTDTLLYIFGHPIHLNIHKFKDLFLG